MEALLSSGGPESDVLVGPLKYGLDPQGSYVQGDAIQELSGATSRAPSSCISSGPSSHISTSESDEETGTCFSHGAQPQRQHSRACVKSSVPARNS